MCHWWNAPENGKEEKSDLFYDELQKQSDIQNNTEHVDIAGDISDRAGNQAIENAIVLFGESPVNGNGVWLREFANTNKLNVTNIFFRRNDVNKCTWTLTTG